MQQTQVPGPRRSWIGDVDARITFFPSSSKASSAFFTSLSFVVQAVELVVKDQSLCPCDIGGLEAPDDKSTLWELADFNAILRWSEEA